MSEFNDWIINEIQNWEFRVEDMMMHSLTGVMMGITVKIKSFFINIRKFISDIFR